MRSERRSRKLGQHALGGQCDRLHASIAVADGPNLYALGSPLASGQSLDLSENGHGQRDMDCDLVSGQPDELEKLARKYGTSVENVKRIIEQTGSRSRARIEEEIDRQFRHQRQGLGADRPAATRGNQAPR